MKREIFKFIKNNFSTDPVAIDRLIVSAFIAQNDVRLTNNKLLKEYLISEHEEYEIRSLNEFISCIRSYRNTFDFETIIELFEFVISPSDRIVNGVVYTPKKIRDFIVQKSIISTEKDTRQIRVSDPACGCGGFLFTIAKELKRLTKKSFADIFRDNLFGLDIKEYSITRAKLLLSLLALYEGEDNEEFHFNLFEGNALIFKWGEYINNYMGFDVIVGNPPYVSSKNIEEESKKYLKNWSVCSYGRPDLYIPFFQIGFENLNQNGVLGYITMNTFFKSLNGRALRKYFKEKAMKMSIIDFGGEQIFNDKYTYTCICLLQRKKNDFLTYSEIKSELLNSKADIPYISLPWKILNSEKGWNLKDYEFIEKIESIGEPFYKKYATSNGIATLKNHIYIFEPIDEDDQFYYLQNGNIFPIEKAICKDIVNTNKLTKVSNITSLVHKAIFPYSFDNGSKKPRILSEDFLKVSYPNTYQYLEIKKDILKTRDKGKGNYKTWYAYGRNQSLEKIKNKLFFPHITPSLPNFVLNQDEELLFYNGIAAISESVEDLMILKNILSTSIFWKYVQLTSKPYSSGYYSLSRRYIKNFGVPNLSNDIKKQIIDIDDEEELNRFICELYK